MWIRDGARIQNFGNALVIAVQVGPEARVSAGSLRHSYFEGTTCHQVGARLLARLWWIRQRWQRCHFQCRPSSVHFQGFAETLLQRAQTQIRCVPHEESRARQLEEFKFKHHCQEKWKDRWKMFPLLGKHDLLCASSKLSLPDRRLWWKKRDFEAKPQLNLSKIWGDGFTVWGLITKLSNGRPESTCLVWQWGQRNS